VTQPLAPPAALRQTIAGREILVAPGVYDGLTALLAEQAGFQAAYLSGASIAYARFGRPDIGLVAMNEVAEVIAAICERVEIPLIVDADTGFGNALNVVRTVRLFERMGAAAIQIEDQTMPKRCGHLAEKSLISAGEMAGKIKAALDARQHDDVVVIARTDAIGVEGLEPALERAARYAEAGADMLFVEAPRSDEEIALVVDRLGGSVPLMANMVEGGRTPFHSAAELQDMGFSLVIFPGGTARAVIKLLADYYASLRTAGTTAPFRDRMLDFDALQKVMGTAEMLALGARYDEDR